MGDTKTVLIVDDIPLMRAMLVKYVKTLGFKILREELGSGELRTLEAANGQEALETLRAESVDLVFLDLMMPVMDGLTFLKVKSEDDELRDVPVIVCSALGEQATVKRASDLGALAYIVKPFTMKSVERKFREAFIGLQTG